MSLRVSFHELAELEMNEAVEFYESESKGLGALNEVERAVQQIREYLESAPLINRVVRRKLVQRFP